MQTHIVRTQEGFFALESEWKQLFSQAAHLSIFQSYEWNAAWLSTAGASYTPFIIIARLDDHAAIAPCIRRRCSRLPGICHTVELIGTANRASDYADVIMREYQQPLMDALWDILLKECNHRTLLNFVNVREDSYLLRHVQQLPPEQQLLLFCEHSGNCPTRFLSNKTEDAKLPNKKSLKRHFNYFARQGTVQLRKLDNVEEINAHLETFFTQHIERRALVGDKSQFLCEQEKSFYRAMAHSMHHAGLLHFSVVVWNGTTLAYHLGFERNGCFIWYKPSFDAQYAKHSPGEVLIRCLLLDALERNHHEFDFTIGDEQFKYRFANHLRENYRVKVFGSITAAWCHKQKRGIRKLIKKLLHGMRTRCPSRYLPRGLR